MPEIQLAVQVCYSISDAETRKREVNALLKNVSAHRSEGYDYHYQRRRRFINT